MNDIDVSMNARRRMFFDLPDLADGYFEWWAAVEAAAHEVVNHYPDPPSPLPAELLIAEGILEKTRALHIYWKTVHEGNGTNDSVEGIAVLSAGLMHDVVFGWLLEGKRARERTRRGGEKGGRQKSDDAADTRLKVIELRRQGLTQKNIAERVGKSERWVREILHQEKNRNSR